MTGSEPPPGSGVATADALMAIFGYKRVEEQEADDERGDA